MQGKEDDPQPLDTNTWKKKAKSEAGTRLSKSASAFAEEALMRFYTW